MFKEIDVIASVHNWPDYDVLAGDVGTVVHVHGDHEAYMVEFSAPPQGRLVALLTMGPEDIRHPTPQELKHQRHVVPREHIASVFPRPAKVS
jgi:hypothetical protein